jgi:ectoine hydroxylase-related dioxygenase (phytanoyl-CoA dioxygenase family)
MHFISSGTTMTSLIYDKIADRILSLIGVSKGTEAFEQVVLYEPSILRSVGGGLSKPQRFHRDNDQDQIRRVATEFCPFNAIVAFEPDSRLDFLFDPESGNTVTGVVDGEGCSHEEARKLVQKYKRMHVNLEPGDVVLFRGDTIHAGSQYTNNNKRLHLYFISAVENDLRRANKMTRDDITTEWLTLAS